MADATNHKRRKILVVDDSEMNRAILTDMLEDEYTIIEAEDGVQAVEILTEQAKELDLVLLDIVMPRMNGFDVLCEMNRNNWIEDVPVIMVSAESGSTQVERAYEMGVTDFISRPFDALIVRRRVTNTILLYAKQKRLVSMVNEQIQQKERHSAMMIDILSHVVEFRNGESGSHVLHVRRFTELLLRHLISRTNRYHLTEAGIALISIASALHDIGKISIDGSILNKPGRLTDEEFAIMKTHTIIGAQMLDALPLYKDDPLIRAAYHIARWHHERYDGRGYPDGLQGDDIPIEAQVVAIADVYDALTSERVYKKAFPHETAVKMILNGECGNFNPLLLQCLEEVADQLQDVMNRSPEEPLSQRQLQSVGTLLGEENKTASERTLRLLDHERMKYNFFASLTDEVQFEYTLSPSRLTLSPLGAKKLNLEEIIPEPENSCALAKVMGEGGWRELSAHLRDTTAEKPQTEYETVFHCGGKDRWFKIIVRSVWSADQPSRYEGALGKALDISETHAHQEELKRKANCDALTGLLNRAGAQECISQRFQARPHSRYALAYFDLDDFKQANDCHGHQFGDAVLREVARRMTHSVRGADICARIGGDEFLLLLEYNTDLERTIDRIHHSLVGPFEQFNISISMGVAQSGDVGLDFEAMFRAADQALYSVKRNRKNQYRFYDESMQDMFATDSITEIDSDAVGTRGTKD